MPLGLLSGEIPDQDAFVRNGRLEGVVSCRYIQLQSKRASHHTSTLEVGVAEHQRVVERLVPSRYRRLRP